MARGLEPACRTVPSTPGAAPESDHSHVGHDMGLVCEPGQAHRPCLLPLPLHPPGTDPRAAETGTLCDAVWTEQQPQCSAPQVVPIFGYALHMVPTPGNRDSCCIRCKSWTGWSSTVCGVCPKAAGEATACSVAAAPARLCLTQCLFQLLWDLRCM